MAFGTAPRRVAPGVWKTRTGRTLTPAGGAYWERKYRTGQTDGQGHITTPPQTPHLEAGGAPPRLKRPGFNTVLAASRGDSKALKMLVAYQEQTQGTQQRQFVTSHGGLSPEDVSQLQSTITPMVNPMAGELIAGMSPTNWFPHVSKAIHGKGIGSGVVADLAMILPFGRIGKLAKIAAETRPAPKIESLADVELPDAGLTGGRIGSGYASQMEELAAVARGEKPATLTSKELFEQAKKQGLPVATVKVPEEDFIYRLVGRDQESLARLETAIRLEETQKEETAQAATLIGRALGYREKDIAHYIAVNELPHAQRIRPEAGQEVLQAVRGTKAAPGVPPVAGAANVYGKQAVLRSAARRERLVKAQIAFEHAGGGMAGHHAYINELRGDLPRVPFNNLAHLDAPTMDRLTDYIYEHPDLTQFEKPALVTALGNARKGLVPRPFEVKLVEKAFGPQEAAEILNTTPLKPSFLHVVEEVWNAPRAILASFDVSGVLRQSLLATVHRPGLAARNIGPMFKMLFSQEHFEEVHRIIRADPEYEASRAAGVMYTDIGHDLGTREEFFASNFAEKITGGKLSFVRASNRAYTGFLNLMRLGLYKNLVALAKEQGIDVTAVVERSTLGKKVGLREGQTEEMGIARLVNWSTGRGELPGKLENPEVAVLLNTFLFSPRLLASRFNALNPVYYASLTPFARKQAIIAMTKLVGVGTTVLSLAALAGAKVGADPRNADFGKIRFGNTRIDLWGGHQQFARLYAQLYTAEIISSTTGEKIQLTGGFAHSSRMSVLGRFLRSKENPSTALIHDWSASTDFQGKPFSWKKAVVSRAYPLLVQDIRDVYNETQSPWQTGALFGIGAFGVGVQAYGSKEDQTPIGSHPDPFARDDSTSFPASSGDPFAKKEK